MQMCAAMDHGAAEVQAFLKTIGSEWNRLVPNGTMEIETDPWSDHIENMYLSIHSHDGITNMYPHIHIFLDTKNNPDYYGFTVSCASDLHFLNKPISASISPTEYCAYFQEVLKTHCQLGEGISEEEKRKVKRWASHNVIALLALALALALAIILFVHLKVRSIPLLKLVFHKVGLICKSTAHFLNTRT